MRLVNSAPVFTATVTLSRESAPGTNRAQECPRLRPIVFREAPEPPRNKDISPFPLSSFQKKIILLTIRILFLGRDSCDFSLR
ncbi:hypothetical protein CEXT_650681 [Caerostris extrusa]|uniref:Uncharacterized protein n=1 Tax=Caerostris extrusa TaxID=172846 RepID=A0AAV4NUN0_CAEEX|nr:hypothetical protein CEXT_650681 [Caerostris extrusa]